MNLTSEIFDKKSVPEIGDLFKVVKVTDGEDVHWGNCVIIVLERIKTCNEEYKNNFLK